jgi:hypothetical protein
MLAGPTRPSVNFRLDEVFPLAVPEGMASGTSPTGAQQAPGGSGYPSFEKRHTLGISPLHMNASAKIYEG